MKIKLPNSEFYYIPDKEWEGGWALVSQSQALSNSNVNKKSRKLIKNTKKPAQSFVYLPHPDRPHERVWQLIQHERLAANKKKKYLKHNKASEDSPDVTIILDNHSTAPKSQQPETRVKFVITQDEKASVYKTVVKSSEDALKMFATISNLKEQGLTPLLLDISVQQQQDSNNCKVIQQIKYGQPLMEVLGKSQLSPSSLTSKAEQYCLKVKAFHNAGFLLNDLTPKNIICSESGNIELIDYDDISEKTSTPQASRKAVTPGFCRKSVEGTYENSSEASDIYALGITLSKIIEKSKLKNLKGLSCLAALMATKEANDSFSLEQAVQWFDLSRQSHFLIEGMAEYYHYSGYQFPIENKTPVQTETEEQNKRRNTIKSFLSFFKTQEEQQKPLDNACLDAIGCLFRYFPDLCTEENWKKLSHTETGAALACVIDGVGKYLDRSRSRGGAGEKPVKDLVVSLFSEKNITVEKLASKIQETIDGNKIIKPSSHHSKSRRKILGKELNVLIKAKELSVGDSDLSQQNILKAKFSLYFPEADLQLKNAYKNFLDNLSSCSPLKKSIIFTSLQYLGSSRAGLLGKKAVREMVENLLCPAPSKINTHSTVVSSDDEKTKIHQAVDACCARGIFSSSERKKGSRAQMFKAVLNTVPNNRH